MSDLLELEPVFSSCASDIHPQIHQQISDLPTPKKCKCLKHAFLSRRRVFDIFVVVFGSIWGFWFLLLTHRKQGVSNILTSIAPRRLALSPMLSSMYLLSSSVIVGCFAGLSYETKSQNMYQTIPKLPLEQKESV